MKSKIRLKDVAERAGVAVNTASTILNKRPNSWASKSTEERVFKAARELGYRPNKTARALQSGRYLTIGLLIQDITNPFYSTLAESLEKKAEEHGYDLMVENCRSSVPRERHLFGELSGLEVDGVITYLSDNNAFRDDLAMRFERGQPTVAIGSGIPVTMLPVDCVISDFTEGLSQAVDAMLELGHRRFAFLSAIAEGQSDGGRPNLLEKMLVDRGITQNEFEIIRCGFEVANVYEHMTNYFKNTGKNRPTAIFAVNDLPAIVAMRAAVHAGIKVPDDISIVGVDDVPLCEFLPITLSSIRQRYRLIGDAAVELLLERIEGQGETPFPPRQRVIPTHFVKRESVGKAPR